MEFCQYEKVGTLNEALIDKNGIIFKIHNTESLEQFGGSIMGFKDFC